MTFLSRFPSYLCIPAREAGHARSMLRTLCSTARAPGIPAHGHGFLVVLDVVKVGEGAL